jgi:Flp pilus assembly pilin Flp
MLLTQALRDQDGGMTVNIGLVLALFTIAVISALASTGISMLGTFGTLGTTLAGLNS